MKMSICIKINVILLIKIDIFQKVVVVIQILWAVNSLIKDKITSFNGKRKGVITA